MKSGGEAEIRSVLPVAESVTCRFLVATDTNSAIAPVLPKTAQIVRRGGIAEFEAKLHEIMGDTW